MCVAWVLLLLRPARVPNRTSRHLAPTTTSATRDPGVHICRVRASSASSRAKAKLSRLRVLLACLLLLLLLLLQAPITECCPPLALQFHDWPASSRRAPPPPPPPHPPPQPLEPRPAFILACLPACLPACPHTHAPPPSASASALRSISTACSFLHRPCPALVQGFFSLYRALRCDHPLTHLLPLNTPAATFYSPPPAMRAACT